MTPYLNAINFSKICLWAKNPTKSKKILFLYFYKIGIYTKKYLNK